LCERLGYKCVNASADVNFGSVNQLKPFENLINSSHSETRPQFGQILVTARGLDILWMQVALMKATR
jgi:hypothetical protein